MRPTHGHGPLIGADLTRSSQDHALGYRRQSGKWGIRGGGRCFRNDVGLALQPVNRTLGRSACMRPGLGL